MNNILSDKKSSIHRRAYLSHKTCSSCQHTKTISQFQYQEDGRGKHHATCITCMKGIRSMPTTTFKLKKLMWIENLRHQISSAHRLVLDCYEDCVV